MRNGQFKSKKRAPYPAEDGQLLVADMVQYLLNLAKLYEKDKTGNAGLSEGLRCVARALRPYADFLVPELTDAIKKRAPIKNSFKITSNKAKLDLPRVLESISKKNVERILSDKGYTKEQIIELGFQRFGISRSKLKRLRKEDARNSVRAALEHEKSLDAIAMEARRGGKARVS